MSLLIYFSIKSFLELFQSVSVYEATKQPDLLPWNCITFDDLCSCFRNGWILGWLNRLAHELVFTFKRKKKRSHLTFFMQK